MRRCAALITALVQLTFAPSARVTFAMQTGIFLRLHVVAQDDTPAMQQVKYAVRDGVCAAYADLADEDMTMLANAVEHLPALKDAAEAAARASGFDGAVSVTIEHRAFDALTLEGMEIPAGEYPALMIRLGDALGHNCWGLIDPELSLRAAATGHGDVCWDWSLDALWDALRTFFAKEGL